MFMLHFTDEGNLFHGEGSFSHTGMAHWGIFGARPTPKNIYTQKAHCLKEMDKKGDFFRPKSPGCACYLQIMHGVHRTQKHVDLTISPSKY